MEPERFTIPSSRGDCDLQCYAWVPEGNIRATLQICHGMIEHSLRYSKFAEFLASKHIAVYAHDHLGHGNTQSGTRGFFAPEDGDKCLIEDLHRMTRKVSSLHPDVKHIILGHSMGSFVLRRYLTRYGEEIDGAIISGTGRKKKSTLKMGMRVARMQCRSKGPEGYSKMLHNASVLSYDKKLDGTKTNRWISTVDEEVDAYNNDPMCNYPFTNRGFLDMFTMMYDLETYKDFRNIPRNLPIIFMSGSDDPVGDFGRGVEECHSVLLAMGLHPGIRIYHGCRHEILHDRNWREVFEDIAIWIGGVIDNEGGLGCRY